MGASAPHPHGQVSKATIKGRYESTDIFFTRSGHCPSA